MAISWTSLCNMALTKLGAKTISNIDTDTTANAVKCRALYETIRDSLLRSFTWTFAIERAELAQLAETPEYEYDYCYSLPTAPYCLRILEMETDDNFEIEGRILLTNGKECKVKYLARVTNPIKLDSLFVILYVDALAARLAISISNSKTLKDRMDIDLANSLSKAKEVNSLENYKQDMDLAETDLWIEAGR